MIDRTHLNHLELRYLDLLAQGHTVKSISILTGKSVAAINERLRDARRKTGVGSSRELARLIKRQESGDEKSDLEVSSAAVESKGQGVALSAPEKRKELVRMSTILLALSATIGAAVLGIHGPSTSTSQESTISRQQFGALTSMAARRGNGPPIVIDQQSMRVLSALERGPQTTQVLRELEQKVEQLAHPR